MGRLKVFLQNHSFILLLISFGINLSLVLFIVLLINANLKLYKNWRDLEFNSAKSALDQSKTIITPTPTIVNPLPLPTIAYPLSTSWVKYNAQCGALKDVDVSYPSGWKLSTEGEQDVTDGPLSENGLLPENTNRLDYQCLLMWGYPGQPRGRQDAFYPDVYGEVSFKATWVEPQNANLDYLRKTFGNPGESNEIIMSEMVNGKEWLTVIDSNKDIYNDTYRWYTVYKGKIYSINVFLNEDVKPDPYFRGYVLSIGKQMLERIRFK